MPAIAKTMGVVRMYARVITFEDARDRIGELSEYVRTEAAPRLATIPDCLGMEFLVDHDRGRAVSIVAFATEEARSEAYTTMTPVRERGAQMAAGGMRMEELEVVLVDSRRRETSGHCMRVTRVRVPVESVDEAIGDVGEFVLPSMRTVAGFGGLVLLVDRAAGTVFVGTSWDDRAAMEASRTAADRVRGAGVRREGEEVVDVEEFEVAFSTLRPPSAHERTIQQVYAAMSAGGNLDDLDGLIAADAVDHSVMPGMPQGLAGAKAMMGMFRTAFPDLSMQIEQYIEQGDVASIRGRMTGTHTGPLQGTPATGRRVDVEMIDIVRFEGNTAVEHWGLFDELGMMHQLGLVTEPARTATTPGAAG